MRAARYRLRLELRTGWRACVALGVVVGIVGGAVLALAAGSRRTDSAYRRFVKAQNAFDVVVTVDTYAFDSRGPRPISVEQIRKLPHVADVAEANSFFVIDFGAGVGVLVPADGRIGTEINRYKMLRGRPLDPKNPTEAVISFSLADEYDIEIGDKIPILSDDVMGPIPPDAPKELIAARKRVLDVVPDNEMTVVGIEASPNEFPPQIEGTGRYLIHASPALAPIARDIELFSEGHRLALVRLDRGARDTDAFLQAFDRIGPIANVQVQHDKTVGVNRSMHTQAVALRLLALLTAIAGALILWQLLARLMYLDQSDGRVLAALGMGHRGRWTVGLGRAATIGLFGACVSVVVALLASPFFPTGLARTAEPSPGFDIDVAVLGLGAFAVAAGVVVLAAWPAWRAARVVGDDTNPRRLSFVARLVGHGRAPVPLSTGVRLALDPGRGGNATAVRSSLAAVTLGVATLVAAITFGAGLTHLLTTPALYGKSWDVALTTYDASLPEDGVPVLAADKRVQGVAVGRLRAAFSINGLRVDGLAVDTVSGHLEPVILAGRPPRADDEIALGTRTMRALHVGLDDDVDAKSFSSDRPGAKLRVVGRAVFPLFGELGRLGDGAFVTRAAWARVQDERLDPVTEAVLVRLAPGADQQAVIRDLEHGMGDPAYGVAVISQGKPTDIVNFGRVEDTPYLLGAVLAILSIVTLTYLLLSALRRRRRDLAILKTLGFVRRQVRSMIAFQATTLVAVALAIGIPFGIVMGRWLWIRFAGDLGIVAVPVVPVLTLALAALVAVVIGNLVAAAPATFAARTKPATVLRSE
jgi:hypothetical protein